MGLIIDSNFTQLIDKISFNALNQGLFPKSREENYTLDMMMNIQLMMNKTLIEILHMKMMNNLMQNK